MSVKKRYHSASRILMGVMDTNYQFSVNTCHEQNTVVKKRANERSEPQLWANVVTVAVWGFVYNVTDCKMLTES
jgi:hypothetical protein